MKVAVVVAHCIVLHNIDATVEGLCADWIIVSGYALKNT